MQGARCRPCLPLALQQLHPPSRPVMRESGCRASVARIGIALLLESPAVTQWQGAGWCVQACDNCLRCARTRACPVAGLRLHLLLASPFALNAICGPPTATEGGINSLGMDCTLQLGECGSPQRSRCPQRIAARISWSSHWLRRSLARSGHPAVPAEEARWRSKLLFVLVARVCTESKWQTVCAGHCAGRSVRPWLAHREELPAAAHACKRPQLHPARLRGG